LLDEPQRPWLDPETLKARFLELSAQVHPDRVHGLDAARRRAAHDRYTALNSAFARLREPRERLRHLLELARGAKPGEVQSIPPALTNLFIEVGNHFKKVDAFLAEKATVTSPLLQVEYLEQGHEWIERLQQLRLRLEQWDQSLMADLRRLDEDWAGISAPEREPLLARAEGLYHSFSFCARWLAQIQERIVQLTL
jgi:curved DNA-binding protein CbpA